MRGVIPRKFGATTELIRSMGESGKRRQKVNLPESVRKRRRDASGSSNRAHGDLLSLLFGDARERKAEAAVKNPSFKGRKNLE